MCAVTLTLLNVISVSLCLKDLTEVEGDNICSCSNFTNTIHKARVIEILSYNLSVSEIT